MSQLTAQSPFCASYHSVAAASAASGAVLSIDTDHGSCASVLPARSEAATKYWLRPSGIVLVSIVIPAEY